MIKRSLQQTNIYLKDPKKRKRDLIKSVVTSTVIEGVYATDAMAACSGKIATQNLSYNSAKSGKAHRRKSVS
jgi:hypothetical protein